MKISLLFYWLAVAMICVAGWLFLQRLGPFLHDILGGKPLPGITQLAIDYRVLFLAAPVGFAGAAIWLVRSPLQGSAHSLYSAVSVLTITAMVSLLLLVTILTLTMPGSIEGGRTPSMWRWLFTGTW